MTMGHSGAQESALTVPAESDAQTNDFRVQVELDRRFNVGNQMIG